MVIFARGEGGVLGVEGNGGRHNKGSFRDTGMLILIWVIVSDIYIHKNS